MNPVLIFRHIACEGPGYLAEFLDNVNVPYQIIKVDEGENIPAETDKISGLVFMGGPMSVNDSLPWIDKELQLIRDAHFRGIPVLGHCLGGQLISKALNGRVVKNEVSEIGWFPVHPVVPDSILSILQDISYDTEVFHWHSETFSLPENAIHLFSNQFCENQGFILKNTIALQFHVEIQIDDINAWLSFYKEEIPKPATSIQSPGEMMRNIDQRITGLHTFAGKIYSYWLNGFAH